MSSSNIGATPAIRAVKHQHRPEIYDYFGIRQLVGHEGRAVLVAAGRGSLSHLSRQDIEHLMGLPETRFGRMAPFIDLIDGMPVQVTQNRDRHYPSLTVKETLEFAHVCSGDSVSDRDVHHVAGGIDTFKSTVKLHADNVIQQLGLDICQNTIVGDAMTRGVSGGERKRVTTGEMAFGNKYVMMMDEISIGLDSAATFDIISTQRRIAKDFTKTVVISLLQPSPEVFALFDDVYEASLVPTNAPRPGSEYTDNFTRSAIYHRMKEDPADPSHFENSHDIRCAATNQAHQARYCIPRWSFYHGGIDGASVLEFVLPVRRNQRPTSYGCSLQHGIVHIGVAVDSNPVFMAAREVLYKQRRANFFRTTYFVLSNSVSQFPLAIAETLVFGSVVYWMCGCAATVKVFLLFELMLFLANLTFAAWFFFLSCASPDLNIANPISLVSILLFVVFGGFVITKDQIPAYLIWIYWLNPMAWSVRALAVNQYTAPSFSTCVYDGVDYCASYGMTMGEFSLTTFEIPTGHFWLWYGIVFMAAAYVCFMLLSYIALEYHRFESPANVMLTAKRPNDDYGLIQTPRCSPEKDDILLSVGLSPDREKLFIPVTVAFKDLCGYALPGTITALMGSSGAGKTTLMDVIAGRKTGGKLQARLGERMPRPVEPAPDR
ncbi:hypothetical protein ON010_g11808 [Phytophthora cinnamomi]|nr:hypothetical protein ON010_g11808 [Phytophthora cinnamomi]